MSMHTSQVFPGGQEKVLTISPTAGNVITNLSPGVGLRWIIRRGRLQLTCDATVANRNLLFSLTDGTDITDYGAVGPTTVGTATINISITEIRSVAGAAGTGFIESVITSNGLILTGADQLRITVLAGVAGDSYSGKIVVLEMAVD